MQRKGQLPQVNFPANKLEFSQKVKVMGFNPGNLLKSFLLYNKNIVKIKPFLIGFPIGIVQKYCYIEPLPKELFYMKFC